MNLAKADIVNSVVMNNSFKGKGSEASGEILLNKSQSVDIIRFIIYR